MNYQVQTPHGFFEVIQSLSPQWSSRRSNLSTVLLFQRLECEYSLSNLRYDRDVGRRTKFRDGSIGAHGTITSSYDRDPFGKPYFQLLARYPKVLRTLVCGAGSIPIGP